MITYEKIIILCRVKIEKQGKAPSEKQRVNRFI